MKFNPQTSASEFRLQDRSRDAHSQVTWKPQDTGSTQQGVLPRVDMSCWAMEMAVEEPERWDGMS